MEHHLTPHKNRLRRERMLNLADHRPPKTAPEEKHPPADGENLTAVHDANYRSENPDATAGR